MKVILDDFKQPQGIFIPLNEWEGIKDMLPAQSQLFKVMSSYASKSIYDMSAQEINQRLVPFTEELVARALSEGHYVTYLSDNANAKFVNEYADGRKELVNIDQATGRDHIQPLPR